MMERAREALDEMNRQLERLETALGQLSDEQVWVRLKPSMNSAANYCLHLAGNEYQNFSTVLGGRPLVRERSMEFSLDGGYTRDELIARLREVRRQSEEGLERLREEDLDREVAVPYKLDDWNRMHRTELDDPEQAKEFKRISTLLVRVPAHYAYHTGQIILLAKLLTGTEEHLSGSYH